MANGVFNISRGSIGYYSDLLRGLTGTNKLHIIVLEAAEADDTLNNYDTIAALLTPTGNTRASSTGYADIEVDSTGVTWTVDDTGNDAQAIIDADQTWTSVSQLASEAWVKLVVGYGAASAADANIRPLTYHDFSVTPNGGDITANFDQTAGFYGST